MDNQQDRQAFFFHVPICFGRNEAFMKIAIRAAKALEEDYIRVEIQRNKIPQQRNMFTILAEDFSNGQADKHFQMTTWGTWVMITPLTQWAIWFFSFMDQMQTIEEKGKVYKSWPMLNKFIETIEKENGMGQQEPEKETRETEEGTEGTTDVEELPE